MGDWYTQEPVAGQTYAEWLESGIPEGSSCDGCRNVVNGMCQVWPEHTAGKKCEWCLRNKYLDNIRRGKDGER